MTTEKSPFEGKKMSIIKLGEVMRCLTKYNRFIGLEMCKGSEVILREGNVVMGPFPNWKAYEILCHILTFEQVNAQDIEDAKAAIKDRPLFLLPTVAAETLMFTPPTC